MTDALEPVHGALRLVSDNGVVRVVDPVLGTSLLELMPAADLSLPPAHAGPPPPALIALADALVASSPHVIELVERSRAAAGPAGDLVVRFAPHIAARLVDGSARLMKSGASTLPKAIDATTGQLLPQGTALVAGVAPAIGSGALGGTAAGGAAVVAGAGGAAVILPIAIAGGAALAASWAQQRWLEQTLGGLERSLARIETRLRDDDLGALAAADALVEAIGDRAAFGDVGPQMCAELAAARFRVESIFRSRLRFVEQFKKDLERWQVEAQADAGHPVVWTKQITETLTTDDSATVAELVVFFQAMLTRCRLASVTTALLVTQGDPISAFRVTDEIRASLRHDYFDLHNRLAALGRADIKAGGLRNVLDSKSRERAHALVSNLAGTLDRSIGDHLPGPEDHIELRLPLEAFARAR